MGEYARALSKDLNVALWLDYRSFNKEKPLKEVYDGDFIIIDEQLHAQFDEFKQKVVPANHSMLNLIDHYLSTKGKYCVFNCVELAVWKVICNAEFSSNGQLLSLDQ